MTGDEDNAGEVVAATVWVALTAAGQLAEHAARRRESALRDAERDSADRLATLQAQLTAERKLAIGSVHDVLRRGGTGDIEELALAWQKIRAWDGAPDVAADRERLRRLVQERFAVDPDVLGGRRRPVPADQMGGRDTSTAATVLGYDTASRGVDAQRDPDVSADVAEAVALAAQSHPTSPTLAARPPGLAPSALRRAGRRSAGLEVQAPGR